MIKRIDRYLLKHFFAALLVVMAAIGITIISINAVEELRDFVDHQVPLLKILEYYVYFGGWVVKSFFPMFILLAVLFSVSILARRQELLAKCMKELVIEFAQCRLEINADHDPAH